MQAIVEMLAAVVVWIAIATLNHLGVQVELPQAEPKVERVIHRDSPRAQEKASVQPPQCPQPAAPQVQPTTIDA